MKVDVVPGNYVVAVSGGVDSMVLLDLLAQQKDLTLTVAHFDHGIRPDSMEDRKLVQTAAARYKLPFIYAEGHLGAGTSEDRARQARHDFLHKTRQEQGAQAIVMAHHQGDVIETMLLNLIRGTGRRGLSSLRSTPEIIRPLLDNTKTELQQYAQERGIVWREDSTNTDTRYLRNYLRIKILPRLTAEQRQQLLNIYECSKTLNLLIDEQVMGHLQAAITEDGSYLRGWFIMLPHIVALDVMAAYLRQHDVKNIDRKQVSRLVTAIKTARSHTMYDVDAARILEVHKKTFQITPRRS